MDSIIALVVSNSVVAGLLGIVALLASRWSRNPQVSHILWLLVLAKLVTPPLADVPLPNFVSIDLPAETNPATQFDRAELPSAAGRAGLDLEVEELDLPVFSDTLAETHSGAILEAPPRTLEMLPYESAFPPGQPGVSVVESQPALSVIGAVEDSDTIVALHEPHPRTAEVATSTIASSAAEPDASLWRIDALLWITVLWASGS